VDPAGTVLAQLELPDGTVQEISTNVKGVVESILVRENDPVQVGDSLFRIAEDKFATYHRRPEKRPIDIAPADPAAPAPAAAGAGTDEKP
jgi:pyruvate/2-oxoglutarate dehydrogenase complex dihydrolipoamide acyltransferase (E2) component